SAEDLGGLKFLPEADFHGTVSFTYQVEDAGSEGLNVSEVATLQIDIAAVSDAPTATTGSVVLDEDSEREFAAADFGFTDAADGDDLKAVIITSLPADGTLMDGETVLDDAAVEGGYRIDVGNLGNLKFVPDE